jgi:hypothetical protein
MLTPFDDYPVHQTALPLAQAGGGHSDFYDRFWFNGYTENFYFAVAMGLYPNRGVIDAAFSVVHEGVQRSVFATGPIPDDRTLTRIGPISIELTEPMRINRVVVEAPDHGLVADITSRARTAAYEEPRQTRYTGARLSMDVTRATQLVNWTGSISSGGVPLDLDSGPVYGTKDRSWGIRGVGDPAPAAPAAAMPQIFFLWAPLNFEDQCLHYMVFEDELGHSWSITAVVLPVIDDSDRVCGSDSGLAHIGPIRHQVRWAPGLRRSNGARLSLPEGDIELSPLMTFRMRGAGYFHPTWSHGRWHGGAHVAGEQIPVADLDSLAFESIHVQQVMKVDWNGKKGLGVLEQLAIGPHAPSGFVDLLGPSVQPAP